MKKILALICLVCCVGVLSLAQTKKARAIKDEVEQGRLLETGAFHGDEVQAKTGEEWLGLYEINGDYRLLPSTLTVEMVEDGVVDSNGEKTGKEVEVNLAQTPVFLIKGINLTPHKSVATVFSKEQSFTPEAREIELDFRGRVYKLKVLTNDERTRKRTPKGFELILMSEGIVQTLLVSESEEDNLALYWAGDLDGDEQLDFYMDTSDHYNMSRRALFLSSGVSKGKLVKKVAEFRTVGC